MCFRLIYVSFCSEPLSKSGYTHVCQLLDNLDYTKNQCTFQKIHSLSMGGADSRVLAYIVSPTSPPYVGKQLTALFHTQPLLSYCLQHCSTNSKLRILVKAQSSTPSTWPSSTRLGIRPWDLGLSNEYTLSHCGLFGASRHKLASTSGHYSLLTATWHDSTLLNSFLCFFLSQSKLIFKFRPPHEGLHQATS